MSLDTLPIPLLDDGYPELDRGVGHEHSDVSGGWLRATYLVGLLVVTVV